MVTQSNPATTPSTNPYAYLNTGTGTTQLDPNANAANNADASRTQLASNYNTFLTLLTSQLQNQDPLSPMDSTAFTQQLVQFSQVEQQIQTNQQLSSLSDQFKAASAGSALSYLGRDAILTSNTTTLPTGGQANWDYNLATTADSVKLSVQDASGHEVFTTTGQKTAGDHLFTWDGKDATGAAAPAGNYKLVVTATDASGAAVSETTTVREAIAGVDFSGTTPTIITASGSHDLSTVRAVLDN
jgi:flagellar basal-body rod modification protein FlgD